MKGNAEVLKSLQMAAPLEAQLNLQCRLDLRSLKNMGLKSVAAHVKKLGDNAHDYLKEVSKRILFLEGNPSYSVGAITEQTSVTALFQNELKLQMAAVQPYEQAVQTAAKAMDDTTRNLFEHLLKWHQHDIGWLEIQLRQIEGLGEKAYIEAKI